MPWRCRPASTQICWPRSPNSPECFVRKPVLHATIITAGATARWANATGEGSSAFGAAKLRGLTLCPPFAGYTQPTFFSERRRFFAGLPRTFCAWQACRRRQQQQLRQGPIFGRVRGGCPPWLVVSPRVWLDSQLMQLEEIGRASGRERV